MGGFRVAKSTDFLYEVGNVSLQFRAVPAKIRAPPMVGNCFFRRGWWVSINIFPVGVVFYQWVGGGRLLSKLKCAVVAPFLACIVGLIHL